MRPLPPWVVLHVPHDSTVMPPEVRDQFLLSDDDLATELRRMTDHHTLDLFTQGVPAAQVVRAPVSRLVVDVERFVDDAAEPLASRGMGVVYRRGSQGQPLRRALTAGERQALIERWYHPHHARLTACVDAALAAHGRALVVDAHSFPAEALPYEQADPTLPRPDICLGTDEFHTPNELTQALIQALTAAFAGAGFTVAVNRPFAGALVPLKHHRRDARCAAVMVEVQRSLYMDEATGTRRHNFDTITQALRQALLQSITSWQPV